MTKMILALLLAALGLLAEPASAVEPDEMLDDPVLEARAREISAQLRCVVCQSENIDSSNALLARDLRLLVRERLMAGDSNEEVLEFVAARYGDFVLLRPPVRPVTWMLWFGPLLFVLTGGGLAWIFFRSQKNAAISGEVPPPLEPEEMRRLDELLNHKGTGHPGEDSRCSG